jgi:hypothetical protein
MDLGQLLSLWAVPAVSWLAGLGSALLLDSFRNRRRMRTVARALYTEVKRLRAAIGTRPNRLVVTQFYGLTVGIPAIHPWVERIVAEGAEIGASVVEAFMLLDSELANMRTYRDLFIQASHQATLAREASDELRREMIKAWVTGQDGAALYAKQSNERPQDFVQAGEFAEHLYLESYDQVVMALDHLDGRFGKLVTPVARPLLTKG